MEERFGSLSFRNINVIESIIGPLFGGINNLENMVDARLQRIEPGPFTEFFFESHKNQFTIWFTGKDKDTGSFSQTRLFKIGYRTESDDDKVIAAVKVITEAVKENEQKISKQTYDVMFLNKVSSNFGIELFEDMAELRLTLKCNEKCPFCNTIVDSHTSPSNIVDDLSGIRDMILQAKGLGAKTIVFTGGEPTLLKDLPEYVEFASSQGLKTWIQTNGLIPNSTRYWERFSVLPDHVFISFHTTRPERVALVTGVGGTFSKKVSALKALRRLNIDFAINFVITKINMDEIELMPDFLYELLGGAGYGLVYSFVAPTGRAFQNATLIPKISEVKDRLAGAIKRCSQLGIRVEVPENCGFPRCVMPAYDGFFMASKRQEPLHDIPADRVKFDRCKTCKYDSTCIGMWKAYVELYGDREFQPVTNDG